MRILYIMSVCVVCVVFATPVSAFWGQGSVPKAANSMGEQLDKQIIARFESHEDGSQSASAARRDTRNRLTIMSTVAVDINNLQATCPLGRQMSEEVSRWLSSQGYRMQELRKGKDIFFEPKQGEMVLTRNTKLLATRTATAELILAGTYVISPDQVRFTMRLIETSGNQVLGIATATVPITEDVRGLLTTPGQGPSVVAPSISTKLQ